MTRKELLELRGNVFEEFKRRAKLGEYDTNAGAILLCLQALVDLIDHTISDMKK